MQLILFIILLCLVGGIIENWMDGEFDAVIYCLAGPKPLPTEPNCHLDFLSTLSSHAVRKGKICAQISCIKKLPCEILTRTEILTNPTHARARMGARRHAPTPASELKVAASTPV